MLMMLTLFKVSIEILCGDGHQTVLGNVKPRASAARMHRQHLFAIHDGHAVLQQHAFVCWQEHGLHSRMMRFEC